jgi:hypothetical protein
LNILLHNRENNHIYSNNKCYRKYVRFRNVHV